MRFTATLDALSRGAGPFETGAMLACISLFPAFFAVKVGRWLDKSGPSGPIHAALFAAAGSGLAALFLPNALFGIFSLFIACLLTGLAFMLMNTVTQRLTGDVCRPGDRQSAFTALSLVTASSNLATPVAAGYVIEHFSFSAFYIWCLIAPVILAAILSLPFMRGLLIKR